MKPKVKDEHIVLIFLYACGIYGFGISVLTLNPIGVVASIAMIYLTSKYLSFKSGPHL